MSRTVEAVKILAAAGNLRISEHGYDELAEDQIAAREVTGGLDGAVVVEEYPAFPKGPAVLVTAYRPDPRRWSESFLERRDE